MENNLHPSTANQAIALDPLLEQTLPEQQSAGNSPLENSTLRKIDAAFAQDPLWYKDAIIYQVHVKSFFDANNDGVGDFPGLIDKLDYISDLGVNTIWLLPFYPSPRRDDGYDISEYTGVHPDYGKMKDVKRFIAEAHKRHLRVVIELVINHTSDQHPWFQRARSAPPGSPERDFYVWSDTDAAYSGTRIIFTDTEKSNWTWDPVANAYFWHRFFSHQPDLNFDNPQVLESVLRIMGFWLDLGVDGLRLDAVPYLIEREGTSNENLPETHKVLKKIRAVVDHKYPGRMLLAEANMWPEDVQHYFGDSDECHMAFNFPLMPRMYLALAQEDRFPITDILRQTPDIPEDCQWAIFLRNHDELTLEMVTDKERAYLYNFYATDLRARINLGIRRRLAPLLQRDRRRIELLNSFLLSMPGTPVLYYGDEIGMGDNIHLGDRDGVRTPMQWTPDRNGGFSRMDPARLVLPPIMDAEYGYQAINVESQQTSPYSLLNWMRRLLAVRKKHQAFGRGSLKLIYPSNRKILAYVRSYTDTVNGVTTTENILCVANVSSLAQAVELDLSEFSGCILIEMLGGSIFPNVGQLPYQLTLAPYGFHWFVLATEAQMPPEYISPQQSLPEYLTLVLHHGPEDIFKAPTTRSVIEQHILPAYLPRQRWYASKQESILGIRMELMTILPSAPSSRELPTMLTEIEVRLAHGVERYLLPMGLIDEDKEISALAQLLALARARLGREVDVLTDAFALDAFVHDLLYALKRETRLKNEVGELRFSSSPELKSWKPKANVEIRRLAGEQSNSSLIIGDMAVLKLIRHVTAGINPEAEMSRQLDTAGYRNSPPFLGEVTKIKDGVPHTLMILQGFVHNQGNAWEWSLDRLSRALHQKSQPVAEPLPVENFSPIEELTGFAAILGRRLGELHNALALPSDNPDFAPEQTDQTTLKKWQGRIISQVERAFEVLQQKTDWHNAGDSETAKNLLPHRESIMQKIRDLTGHIHEHTRTRIHGDFHLGQILVISGDVMLIDFEGEPARPVEQRREKDSPWRDVAGVLRSFAYAAAFMDRNANKEAIDIDASSKEQLLGSYVEQSTQCLLAAYIQARKDGNITSEISSMISSSTDHQGACRIHAGAMSADDEHLLQSFMLEKVAYEICYEAANRPEWIGVPLQGLAKLSQKMSGQDMLGYGTAEDQAKDSTNREQNDQP